MTAPVQTLLGRLEGVRKSGKGWVARCPAHADRTASLSVGEGDDGRVLLHCFAGCGAADVVHSVGLSLGDLFPARLDRHMDPAARLRVSMETRTARQYAALSGVLSELAVIEVAAARVARGEPLSAADAQRVSKAHDAIHRARQSVMEVFR